MKRETKEKIKGGLMRFGYGLKEMAPLLAAGAFVGGWMCSIGNNIELHKHEKRIKKLEDRVEMDTSLLHDEVIPKHNQLTDHVWDVVTDVEKLKQENRFLMERALKESEGKKAE